VSTYDRTYDVVVAGLGGFGSATAYHLAARGLRVLGVDPYPGGHALGSSHGESRIVRQAYFEGSAYVPLLRRAYELWDQLAVDSGESHKLRTGGLFLGRAGTRVFEGSLASARDWDIAHEVLDADEVTRRFPAFRPPPGTAALFEPDAGLVRPERAVLAHLRLAAAAGADLRHGEALTGWTATGTGVSVRTGAATYAAGALVLAPGRWAPELLGDLALPLRVERRVMHWFRPPGGVADFDPDRCPVWIWDRDDGTAPYGLPSLDGDTVKTSVHYSSLRAPDAWTPDQLTELLAELLPGLGRQHVRAVDCCYTLTPDEHFVVGRHPAHDNVVLACGFSGHGFKFTPVLGEVLADLATGNAPPYDVAMFDPRRFAAATAPS
jgi:sarcosine oxidase